MSIRGIKFVDVTSELEFKSTFHLKSKNYVRQIMWSTLIKGIEFILLLTISIPPIVKYF